MNSPFTHDNDLPGKPFTEPCQFCKHVHGSNPNCASCREFGSFIRQIKQVFGPIEYIRTETVPK